MTNDPIIKIEQLEKSFGDLHVLKGINLEVDRGEVVCIIGASGSGKSTLLRCINLLEEADSGHIWFDGQDLMATSRSTSMPCGRRSAWCFRASTFSTTSPCWTTARSRP